MTTNNNSLYTFLVLFQGPRVDKIKRPNFNNLFSFEAINMHMVDLLKVVDYLFLRENK